MKGMLPPWNNSAATASAPSGGQHLFRPASRLAPLVAIFPAHPSMEIEIRESTTTRSFRISIKGAGCGLCLMYPEGLSGPDFSQYPEYRSHSCFRESIRSWSARTTFAGGASSHEDLASSPLAIADRTMDVYHRSRSEAFDATGSPCISPYAAPHLSALFCIYTPKFLRDALLSWSSRVGRPVPSSLRDALLQDTQMVILNQKRSTHVRSFYHYVKTQKSGVAFFDILKGLGNLR